MSDPEVSIVIRTFNEERHLPALLDAIDRQGYRDFETIVVDSGSIDLTCEIAERRADMLLRIASRDFTFGFSLNSGIEHARGRFIAIISAHALPVNDSWLSTIVQPLRADSVAMTYGRQAGAPTSKFAERQDFARLFGSAPIVHSAASFFANNANSAIRRDLWERYPFDATLPGLEDMDWAKHWLAAGYVVIYEPAAEIWHLHEESWPQVRRRYYREAVAARWIGVASKQAVPAAILRELKHAVHDLWIARRQRQLSAAARGVVLFRLSKTVGTVRGLRDGKVFAEPKTREEMLFDRTCRAVTITGPGHATLTEVEIPALKPGDVLIRVAYEGVCGTDLEIFTGTLGYYKSGKAKYSIVPGHELSGTVVALGCNVTGVLVGDRVVVECIQSCGSCADCRRGNWVACPERKELGVIGLNGGYAQYVVTQGHFVHIIPASLHMRTAALCEPLAVVLKGVKRLERIWQGERARNCFVAGAGPIGFLAARVLSMRGHAVTVYDQEPMRRGRVAESGIGVRDQLDGLSDFDALVDATGDPTVLTNMLHESAPGAAILLLGLPYARREYSFEDLVTSDKILVGSVGSCAEDFEDALQLLPMLGMEAYLEDVYPLEKFQMAWQAFRGRQHLKVLLQIDGQPAELNATGSPSGFDHSGHRGALH